MRLLLPLILIGLFLFSACSPEKKSRQQIKSLEASAGGQKYEVGIACMQYILKEGDDLVYSKSLVRKLLDIGFSAESIYAAEWLLRKYPDDADLFCLRAIGYRRLHQYKLAREDFGRALTLQPKNNTYIREAEITAAQQRRWLQIQRLSESLTEPVDSFDVLLDRAGKFFELKEYDAVLYDLGSISKMGSPEDSLYYKQKVSALYTTSPNPVETLTEILEYFKGLER